MQEKLNWIRTLTFQKNLCYLRDWKLFRNDEKWFLFHLKSSFRPQDIQAFVTNFWSCRKNGLIRKIRLTSEFMTSQPDLQTIAIHIFPNISQSKGNQTMKFSQLIEYCGKWSRESSRPLYFLKKLNMRWKQVVCSLVSIYCDSPQLAIQ